MGRSVANTGFLRALLHADPYEAYHFFLPDTKACAGMAQSLQENFPALWKRGALEVTPVALLPRALAEKPYHCFHLSDCVRQFAPLCRLRNFMAANLFAITGTTHTLSYARYFAEFLGHVWAGTTPRDAVIATSTAGRDVMRAYYRSLRESFSLGPAFQEPRVCRIPLGTDIPDPALLPGLRGDMREQLGLAPEEIALLALGRFSHYSKMDLIPLLRAIHLAASESFCRSSTSLGGGGACFGFTEAADLDKPVDLSRVRLILAGWTDTNDDVPDALVGFARNLGIRCNLIKRPNDKMRAGLYAAADIFVSPSDNVQETFGLTLLEAGAFRLPVIAADWSGYRDIVQHGKTGVLVPTIGWTDTLRTDVLAHVFYDNQTHLALAQETVVHIPALALALRALIHNSGLRANMGHSALELIRRLFSWPKVVERHVALWDALCAIPVERETVRNVAHPLQFSYARVFAGHPAQVLQDTMLVQISALGRALYRGQEAPVLYAGIEERIPLPQVRRVLVRAMRPVTVGRLRQLFESDIQEDGDFVILWLLKQGYLEWVCSDAPFLEQTGASHAGSPDQSDRK